MANLSANRRIRREPEQAARCSSSKKQQAPFHTTGLAADGFLKHRFLPLYQQADNLPDKKQVEQGFKKSLSILTNLYNFKPLDVSGKAYPYNILLAHWDASQQLNTQNQQVELLIIQDEQGKIQLSTKQTYDTGTTLYYIPVMPLYRLLQDKRKKQIGELILSVFAYLFRVAGVPYYRDSYSALSYYYEMLQEWLNEDVDGREAAEINKDISELNAAAYYGDVIFRKLYNPYHLNQFKQRIDRFKAKDGLQKEGFNVAMTAYELWQAYPERSVFKHIGNDEQEYEDGIVRGEQYISFIADNEGWLYNSLSDMVNNEFNECAEMEEPCIAQVFDHKAIQLDEGLSFEHRFFPLINDVCTLLNKLP